MLISLCPRFRWHDIFREVDRLGRESHIRLVAKGCGIYVVSLQTDGCLWLARTDEQNRNGQAFSIAQLGLFMNAWCGIRSSRPAGLFSFGLLDGPHVRLRRPHLREVPAGYNPS